MTTHRTEYACTLKGVALLALDNWNDARARNDALTGGAEDDGDRMIMYGRRQAYATILRLVTGVSAKPGCEARWEESIDAMR